MVEESVQREIDNLAQMLHGKRMGSQEAKELIESAGIHPDRMGRDELLAMIDMWVCSGCQRFFYEEEMPQGNLDDGQNYCPSCREACVA